MRIFRKSVWITLGVALLLVTALAAAALAAGQGRERRQAARNQEPGAGAPSGRIGRMQDMPDRIVLGEITSIDGDTVTVKPELPPELLDRLAEHGVEPPALPASIKIKVTADSKLLQSSGPAHLESFKVGDKIAAFCDTDADGSSLTVRRMADADTARQAVERFRAKGGSGRGLGPGAQGGPGRPGLGPLDGAGAPGMGLGPGADLRDRMPPVFGKITSVTDDEISLKVEIPDFILERMTGMGREIPEDLPDEVTVKYGERTRFRAHGGFADSLPFKVGDLVMAVVVRNEEELGAVMICDLATVKERLEEGFGGMGPGSGRRGGSGACSSWRAK